MKTQDSATFRKYDTTLTQFGETQIGILCDISLYSLSKQYFTSTSQNIILPNATYKDDISNFIAIRAIPLLANTISFQFPFPLLPLRYVHSTCNCFVFFIGKSINMYTNTLSYILFLLYGSHILRLNRYLPLYNFKKQNEVCYLLAK